MDVGLLLVTIVSVFLLPSDVASVPTVKNLRQHQPKNYDVRLVGGSATEGIVEVYYNGWKAVCSNGFNLAAAQVVCRQLGFPSAAYSKSMSDKGMNTPIHFKRVHCERNLMNDKIGSCEFSTCLKQPCCDGSLPFAGVVCREIEGTVRLRGGDTANEGRVEIVHNCVWGTVCDDSWGEQEGAVVCRQLGYPGVVRVTTDAFWGEGTGPVYLDEVRCTGDEASITICQLADFETENCNHSEDAGVECIKSVRLTGGNAPNKGRVEVFVDGEWGTVCDDLWGLNDADVVCRELGYVSAFEVNSFGAGTGMINLDDVSCNGDELSILACDHAGPRIHNCDHDEDAGVVCTNSVVRLVGGSVPDRGRVEVFVGGDWGTVCDHSWDINDAHVVCRELGYARASEATSSSDFGAGSEYINLDKVHCRGDEASLLECGHDGPRVHDCGHHEDAGVVCTNLAVRLAGGRVPDRGRVEVFVDGEWGTVCDDSWDIADANVVCRELGYMAALDAIESAGLGAGSGVINLDEVRCNGDEQSLLECDHSRVHNCAHYEDAGAVCTNTVVRLVNGSAPDRGRVEVFVNGAWGTVCDNSWDLHDAQVVCRELGYFWASEATSSSSFGAGTGHINLNEVSCNGHEQSLVECDQAATHNCNHSNDAGVVCTNNVVRLVGGDVPGRGRVEVFLDGAWGTVCDKHWDINDAKVVCRELGYAWATRAKSAAHFGAGSGYINLGIINCNGDERSILECDHAGPRVHDCLHQEDAGVVCTNDVADCEDPGIPLGGFRYSSSLSHGGIVHYGCTSGFTINGAEFLRCENGKWNASIPRCSRCEKGSTYFNGSCYSLTENREYYDIAKATCEKNDGHLATFTKRKELTAIHTYKLFDLRFYIGVKAQGDEWERETSEDSDYFNWPSDHNCAYHTNCGDKRWNNLSPCTERKPFICEIQRFWPNLCSTDTQCLYKSIRYNDHCYHVEDITTRDWSEAQRFCRTLHGHLVVISDRQEQEAVNELLNKCGPFSENQFWIGLRRESPKREWKWMTPHKPSVPYRFKYWPDFRCAYIMSQDRSLPWYYSTCDDFKMSSICQKGAAVYDGIFNPCDCSPCENGARCFSKVTDDFSEYYCVCPTGSKGKNCEIQDDCNGFRCANNKCIQCMFTCDLVDNCGDNSDEGCGEELTRCNDLVREFIPNPMGIV